MRLRPATPPAGKTNGIISSSCEKTASAMALPAAPHITFRRRGGAG